MADSMLSTMDAVAALMQEREKYEGWLAALEGRRATTPARVYERVGADYRSRLDHVLADIAGRASELEAVSAGLRTRVESLQADEESRAEERAEAELRAAVGEYSAEQWEELRSVADAEIAHVSTQLAEQRAELDRVEGILAIARRPRATPESGRAVGGGTPASRAPDAAPAAASTGGARPRDDRYGAGDTGTSIGIVRGAAASPAPAESSVVIPFTVDDSEGRGARDAETAPRRAGPDAGWPDRESGDAAFDDLAFLKSIVEPTASAAEPAGSAHGTAPANAASGASTATPSGGTSSTRPIPRGEESRLSTPGRGLAALRSLLGTDDKSARSATPATPAGRDDARSAPSRDDSGSAAAKTLRCGECGTLNYPTEWYCERCGGELAAL